MKIQSAIPQNNRRTGKSFLVLGYAVNKRGLTIKAESTVSAADQKEAITLAAADLRWQGLTYFKALRVYEV
ncbi:TPA: hypothetical protein I8Y21_005830 [Klebsiella oxytoca]|uniref:Uncharacterized protein n=1 Tax=Klebsiella oxytoca TaxID=571 RepID=A0AAN5LF79_KLEOX|nr:hypothetical protein [Klebsiella oxytoca]